MSRLQNKVAVITGGTSGIGLSTAQRFVEEGAHVFIFGRRQQELDKAAALIGRNVTAVQGDASKIEDLDRLFSRVQAEKGHLNVLVASAGVVEIQMFGEVTAESYDKTFDINVRGLLNASQKALPLMKNGGSIILVSSIAAFMGFPRLHHLQRDQGRGSLLCADLDGRAQEQGRAGQRPEPRPHRHPDHRRPGRYQGGCRPDAGAFRLPHPGRPDGTAGRTRQRGPLPCLG
jgi:NAD(P)-dependent dehydrogenase (short-subunit alcohol dehydrogenase family)